LQCIEPGKPSLSAAGAEALLRAGLARDPADLALVRRLSTLLHTQSRYESARAVLKPALCRGDAVAFRLDGMAAYAMHQLDDAVASLRRAWEAGDRDAGSYLAVAIAKRDGLDAAADLNREILAAVTHAHRPLRLEAKRLLRAGRPDLLDQLCAMLHQRGARHAQLYSVWAAAKARLGEVDAVSRLLGTRHVRIIESLDNVDSEEIARELIAQARPGEGRLPTAGPYGGQRIDRPMTLDAVGLRGLERRLREAVEDYLAELPEEQEPALLPTEANAVSLHAWGVVLTGHAAQGWHVHPAALVTGIYYAAVPDLPVSAGLDAGALELGLLPYEEGFGDARWRRLIRPRAGMLVMFPAAYAHRTIPTRSNDPRVSLAFDVKCPPQ
jgi:hypothetical protein